MTCCSCSLDDADVSLTRSNRYHQVRLYVDARHDLLNDVAHMMQDDIITQHHVCSTCLIDPIRLDWMVTREQHLVRYQNDFLSHDDRTIEQHN